MWGIVPAAGVGSRIQPLAFSKELLPVGSRTDDGVERPRRLHVVGVAPEALHEARIFQPPDRLPDGELLEHDRLSHWRRPVRSTVRT